MIFALISVNVQANNGQKVIKKANKLITNKKYATAFKLLDQVDPLNLNTDIFLLKFDLATKYAVSTKDYRFFSFKDFKNKENIDGAKIELNNLESYDFKIDLIFDSLLQKQSTNCKLHKIAADYLFDINLKFGQNWVRPESDYLKQMALYSEKTINLKCADDKDYYKIGYYLINVGKYKESIYFLYQSILKNETYATSHYNLAFAYLMTKAPAAALKHAKKAFELYSDSLYKSDASRILAESYFQNNQVDSAIIFYEKAEELDSSTINNIASLLNIYLKVSNIEKADLYFNKIFKIDPNNPAIYNQIEQIYANNGLNESLIKKYEYLLTQYTDNIEVIANLKYYLARLYSLNDTERAVKTYEESRKYFEKIYKIDHPVFASIDKSIEQLKVKTK